MCHCSFDATFSPDWQHLRSAPHMSIFPQAFCCNKRVAFSSLPLPTMSINATSRHALHSGMSSLSEWRSHRRGLRSLSLSALRGFEFFPLTMHPPPWCSGSRRDVSLDARRTLRPIRACEGLHTQMLSCTSFFFQ